jgi:tetratricopeptide (TPR) repeat protein
MVYMRRSFVQFFFLLILAGATLSLPSQTAGANDPVLIEANKLFQTGRYDEALALFQHAKGTDLVSGVIGASRTWAMTGQYAAAEEICRETLQMLPWEVRTTCQLAEILTLTGRSDEAMGILQPVAKGAAPPPRCLVQYGKLLRMRGRRDEAVDTFERVVAFYHDGQVYDSEDLAMAAVASWALERFHDANRLFREALRTDPKNLEAQVLWGDLFHEKYNHAEARKSYAEALEQNEKYVPALVGMAKTLKSSAAQKILATALEINGRFPAALESLAELSIEDDHFAAAKGYLEQMLQTNPESLAARTLLAAIAYLEDDYGTYKTIRKGVEQFSPGNGRFHARIGEICGRKYRFAEAVDMARLAVKTDPRQWHGYTILGMNLLRLGHESVGRAHLKRAFDRDPFNVWTINMLRVLDVLAGFETRRTAHFTVRMHASDADILWPYLKPLLEESWDTLTAKYGFTPEGPILVEIFREHEDFAVRTSGLPDIGPLVGVCFGRIITLDSPWALKPPRSMNWQEIVWHEFTHVITLQMTRNRLPRWLSEGISVYEEHQGRPEWGRKQDMELVKAVQENRILPMKNLNEGFSKAESPEDLGFAYYQSSLVVEYIVDKYGFDSLKGLITQYGTPKDAEDIFVTVFQDSLASFEKGFISWLHDKVSRINVYVPTGKPEAQGEPEPTDSEALAESMRQRIEAHPGDFQAHFQLGIILYKHQDFDGAIKHLAMARDLLPEYGDMPNPRQVLAQIYEARGDEAAMLQELEALVRFQQHAFDASYKLAQAYREKDDYTKAAYFLERAIAVDPYHPDVHRLLARMAFEKADFARAIKEYKILVALEVTDPVEAYTDLAEAYLFGGKKRQAKGAALSALEIAPTFERAQSILLDALDPEGTIK